MGLNFTVKMEAGWTLNAQLTDRPCGKKSLIGAYATVGDALREPHG